MNALVHHTNSLARDAESTDDVENFPFALSVSMILMTGLCLIGWGIIVTSSRMACLGLLITLAGCVVYGWSLYDE
jgi:hypothetical protein